MQTCQAAAGLTLRRLPFSPWANQTELWEGHPRLWCLCRRGNSAWQLLAFRQQPVFMEIIPPHSGCSRLRLIKAWMKTKLSFSAFSFCFFFLFLILVYFLSGQPRMSKTTIRSYRVWQCTTCFQTIHTQEQHYFTADIETTESRPNMPWCLWQ